ncbi:MAG: hypothetical protein AAFY15_04315 [Cyanobacteria bacterium J06648_11]
MNLKKLQELKRKLLREQSFSKIWGFYMDNFADFPEFTDAGDRAENTILDGLIREICHQLFGDVFVIQDTMTIYIPEQKFYHGPLMVSDRIGGFIYFEDVQMGMVAIEEAPRNGRVKYARFADSSIPKQNATNN